MKTYNDLIQDALQYIDEIFPWDLEELLQQQEKPLVLDIREADEYEAMHIKGSMFVPRGILEQACEWDFDETVPELVKSRDLHIVIVCRSGSRSVMAAYTLHQLGFKHVVSLKTGIRGWNDYEQPLVDINGNDVDIDIAEDYLGNHVRDDQKSPSI